MRIGVDIRSLLDAKGGGVATYTEKLLTNLAEVDTQNEYLLFYNIFQKNNESRLKEKFYAPNFEIRSFNFPNKLFNASLNYIHYPQLDKLLKGTDLFFVPNLTFLALSASTKKVITLHDLSFLLYPKFYSVKGRWWHQTINPQKIVKKFDKIIAVSESTKNDVINLLNIDPNKISAIYSGIDAKEYQLSNAEKEKEIVKKYQLPDEFILSLSAIEPRKNIDSLVSAFKLFQKHNPNSHHLVIVGGLREKAKDFRSLYQDSEFKDRIHFIGYVPNEEKPYLYRLADLFVYPSFYEGFGFPPLEAMASSTPVIASCSSSLSEVCDDAVVLIDPYNIKELAVAIDQVITNDELSHNLVEKGLKQVQKFPWQKTAQNTLNLFKSLVE